MDAQLRKFTALVESGSYTKAAANLHISQPALSVAIAKLERTLKHTLLQSSGRQGLSLTEAGRAVYAAALQHRTVDQNLQQQLSTLQDQKPQLRIGMIDSIASDVCAADELLAELEDSTDLVLSVANSTSLRTALLADKLDLAVVVADQVPDAALSTVSRTQDRLVLVCAAEKFELFQRAIDRGETLQFVSYVSSSRTYDTISTALSDIGVRTDVVLSSTSPDVMLAMVVRGRGAALLPENLVRAEVQGGTIRMLNVKRRPFYVRRPLKLVKLKGRQLPAQAEQFIAYVQSIQTT